MSLTKTEIFGSTDRSPELLEVPEWGGDVYIAALPENEWRRLQRETSEALKKGEDGSAQEYEMVVLSVYDAGGVLLFDKGDIKTLGERNHLAIERIVEEIMRVNGLSEKAVKDSEKNFEAPSSNSSGTS